MKLGMAMAASALALSLGGCISETRTENAALRMPWPRSPTAELVAYAPPANDYPSVGGDILKGASPADQAAARAAAAAPIAVGKP